MGRSALEGAVLSLMMLSACATPRQDSQDSDDLAAFEEPNDPLEKYNRYIGKFNDGLDWFVFRPTAVVYRVVVPSLARDALRNFFDNLRAPVILVNDLLQGEGKRAGITAVRFLTNSTLGLGGFIDTADKFFGLEFHNEDFGQTLAVWGLDEGYYLVLPLIGPSNPRDAIGIVVDSVLDPWNYLASAADASPASATRLFVNGIDKRARNIDSLDEIKRTSIDYYATLRSLYRQRRADEIRNGAASPFESTPINQRRGAAATAVIEPTAEVSPTTTWAGPTSLQGKSESDQPIGLPFERPAGQLAMRAYVEAFDDILGYRFTVEGADGRVAMQLSARKCERLKALIRELLPRDWVYLLKSPTAVESPASCRIEGGSGLV